MYNSYCYDDILINPCESSINQDISKMNWLLYFNQSIEMKFERELLNLKDINVLLRKDFCGHMRIDSMYKIHHIGRLNYNQILLCLKILSNHC